MKAEIVSFIFFVGGLFTWFIKHQITTTSRRNLDYLKERERLNNQNIIENIKSELSHSMELRKIRFSSIYERKINSLMDVYSCVQKYEISISWISKNIADNGESEFDPLYTKYIEDRNQLIENFWCKSALFSDEIINLFNDYRKNMNSYDIAYEKISKSGLSEFNDLKQLPALEYEQRRFSEVLKKNIKYELNNS